MKRVRDWVRSVRLFVAGWLAAAFVLLPGSVAAETRSWAPLDPQDLKMTEFKPLPGAEAVMLYYVNEIDDVDHKEFLYSRIKILSDSGKRYATVEIPMLEKTSIADFYARTIQPDGKVTEFSGQPYEKVVLKARGVRVRVQSFSLPQVNPGSIVEYRYELHYGYKGLRHHQWDVQHDLYAVKEHFLFRYDKHYTVRWLPAKGLDKSPDNDAKAGTLRMDAENIAPFEPEEQMPPESAYRMNMKFFYTSPYMSSPSAYWFEMGQWWSRGIDYFIGNHKEIKQAADEAIGTETDPEKKLRKLYERAQQVRNLSYERHRTGKEQKQEDIKEDKNVVEVLKRGYGDRNDITMFFVGMARAEGFTASVVLVSSRESSLFDREVLSFSQLDSEIASVRLNGKVVLLDPGTRFCPYGLLRWMRTGTAAMDMHDPGNLVSTPGAGYESAIVSRSADMKLSAEGSAKGEVRIEFTGADALERRLAALDTDEAGRKKELEDELKEWLPVNARVEMTASSGWEDQKQALVAVFNVEVPEFASAAGKRLLVPVALFKPKQNRVLKNGTRKYPVYYHYAFTEDDHLSLQIPEGYTVETLAAGQPVKISYAEYSSSLSSMNNSRVNMERKLKVNGIVFMPERYQELRDFFAKVQAADESQTVLTRSDIFSTLAGTKPMLRKDAEQFGLKQRQVLGRTGLARLADREFDPLEVLRRSCRDHVARLIPVKFERMSASAFAFFRGAVELMAADLGGSPNTGIEVQLCGDAHLKNFGFFASPGADIILDINDFDQTQRGPWEWDVKRMATSIMLAGRIAGDGERGARAATAGFLNDYVRWIRRFGAMPNLEVARHRTTRDTHDPLVRTALRQAERSTPESNLQKLTRRSAQGHYHFIAKANEIWEVSGAEKQAVLGSLPEYCETLAPEHRMIFDRYRAEDVGFKVVGTGSVGTRDYVVLLFGRDHRDPLFLQIKEETASAYSDYYRDQSVPRHQGERVVRGQRAMQVYSDMLLGWTSIQKRHYLVRQLSDHKSSIEPEALNGRRLHEYSCVCAELLAKGHARSAEPAMLASYLGRSDKAARALLDFAVTYADRTEKDYNAFKKAVKKGFAKSAAQGV